VRKHHGKPRRPSLPTHYREINVRVLIEKMHAEDIQRLIKQCRAGGKVKKGDGKRSLKTRSKSAASSAVLSSSLAEPLVSEAEAAGSNILPAAASPPQPTRSGKIIKERRKSRRRGLKRKATDALNLFNPKKEVRWPYQLCFR